MIASDEKGVTVSRAGKQTLLPLAQSNSFELSERREIALAAGDSVRITKNFRCGAERFTNNELCRVAAIDQAGIHLDDGRLIKVAEPLAAIPKYRLSVEGEARCESVIPRLFIDMSENGCRT